MSDNPKPGYVRVYVDHTGRWYDDITQEEYDRRVKEFGEDPLAQFVTQEIKNEIDNQIIKVMKEKSK